MLTPEGVKPDPSKVEAILKMERPKDVAAVRRLVGLVNYLSKFLRKLSEVCEPLRRVSHKDVEWRWSEEQEDALERVKQAVTSAPVLRYFDSSLPVEGQGDASSNGIGFVLMQNGQPVFYSSRALTVSESGPEMYLSDTLSRAYLPTTDRSPAEKEAERIHGIDFLPISEPQLVEIQHETATDPVMQSLTQIIVKGWPDTKDDLPLELRPYFDVRDELTAQDGVVFKGLRCLIPSSLRPKIRERLHGAHSGIESCLRRARETVYWPNMTAEIKDYIAKCEVCATYQKEQPKEPLICHKIRSRPWETVGSDIFHFQGRLPLHSGLLFELLRS